MEDIEYIKNGIERLYKANPNIHISLSRTRPRLIVEASPARIVGVYKSIFQIEENNGSKHPARHTFQYTEVLIGQIEIKELNYIRPESTLKRK